MGDLVDSRERFGKNQDLEKMEQGESLEEIFQPPPDPIVSCRYCLFSRDRRPWWKRLFQKLGAQDLLCSTMPRRRILHPITGEDAYVSDEEVVLSMASKYPHPTCQSINLTGNCKFYRGTSRKQR